MIAVLLGAGRGTRLAAATGERPKILAPVGSRTLLDIQLDYLAANGVERVLLNTHHRAEQVRSHLAEANSLPVPVELFHEEVLLGTAGALIPMRSRLRDPFVVLYGDVVTDVNIPDLYDVLRDSRASAVLACTWLEDVRDKGVCVTDADMRIVEFREKATQIGGGLVNGGLHLVDPAILDCIGRPPQDFGFHVWPRCLRDGLELRAVHIEGYLQDIGTPRTLDATSSDLKAGRLRW